MSRKDGERNKFSFPSMSLFGSDEYGCNNVRCPCVYLLCIIFKMVCLLEQIMWGMWVVNERYLPSAIYNFLVSVFNRNSSKCYHNSNYNVNFHLFFFIIMVSIATLIFVATINIFFYIILHSLIYWGLSNLSHEVHL